MLFGETWCRFGLAVVAAQIVQLIGREGSATNFNLPSEKVTPNKIMSTTTHHGTQTYNSTLHIIMILQVYKFPLRERLGRWAHILLSNTNAVLSNTTSSATTLAKTTDSWTPNTDGFALLHLESSGELGDEPNDFVVLDVVVSVLHQVPPKHLSKREGF